MNGEMQTMIKEAAEKIAEQEEEIRRMTGKFVLQTRIMVVVNVAMLVVLTWLVVGGCLSFGA